MPGLLLIAHAPLASALKSVAEHAFPDANDWLVALDVSPSMPVEEVERLAAAALASVRRPQTLILADVFGATPFNVAQRMADGVQVRVVAGVNVPMLWRAATYRDAPLDTLVERAMAGATQGVLLGAGARPQNQSIVRTGDDQANHHHQ
jgi:PTS system ascorbate-specific IIA component